MHAFTLELLIAFPSVGDITIISVKNDDLTTLIRIVIKDLLFELVLDSFP